MLRSLGVLNFGKNILRQGLVPRPTWPASSLSSSIRLASSDKVELTYYSNLDMKNLVKVAHSRELQGGADDPCCDPNNPRELTYQQVSIAQHRLKDTGSFKERGGRFALMNLTDEEKKSG
ncbi:hypothetical protein OESDEN_23841, partial [Oesophagostomum dentatum]